MRFALPILLALSGLGLAGCGEQVLSTVPATSAAECQAQYAAAQGRSRNAAMPVPANGAGLLGAAIGRGIAEGSIDSAYRACLARVGGAAPVTAATAPLSATVQTTAPVVAGASCSGSAVLQGGAGYCVAR